MTNFGAHHLDIADGTTFIGTKGRVAVRRGKLTTEPAELATSPLDSAELIQLYRGADYTTDFLDCMRSRELVSVLKCV